MAEGRRKVNLPPGPKGLPLIGNFHQLRLPLHRTYSEFSKKYGPIIHLRLAGVPLIVVSNTETANEVLKTQDLIFCSRPRLVSLNRFSYDGLGVAFSVYGEQWRETRRIFVSELLSNKKILSFRIVIEEEIARAIASIKKKLDNGGTGRSEVDVGDLVQTMTISMMCQMAFGKLVGEDGDKMEVFHKSVEEINSLGLTLFAEDFFSGGVAAATARVVDRLRGLHRRLDKTMADLDVFFEDVMEEHKARKKQEGDVDVWVERDIVDVMLRLHNERPLGFTANHIKAALMDIFIAGTDTPAVTATWAVAELINNPRVLNKVYEELTASTFSEKKEKGKEKVVLVNEEDLVNLHYLELVVKETLRLHPPGTLLVPRQCMKATQIDGYDVLPGTRVSVNVWAMGRDPKYWDNPDEFWPERFAGDDGGSAVDYKGQHFHYLPFGGGRRICPGIQLGVMMVELVLANLLLAFKWEVPNGAKGGKVDMKEIYGLAISKKEPLILNASKRI